jgi:co-chaperonin GroES (HSP10)
MSKVKMSDYSQVMATEDKILVEVLEVESEKAEMKTESGIVIPDTSKDKMTENPKEIGVIVDIGPKYIGTLQKGDHIVYGTFVGAPVFIDGKKYLSLDSDKTYIRLYK